MIKVVNINTNEVFYYNNFNIASVKIGISSSTVKSYCTNKKVTKNGYKFKRISMEDYLLEIDNHNDNNNKIDFNNSDHWLWSKESLIREKKIKKRIEEERVKKYGR